MLETVKRYEHSDAVSVDILEKFLDDLWAQLKADGATRIELTNAGIAPDQLPDSREDAFKVTRPAAGASTTEIVITLLPLIAKVAGSMWEIFVMPKLRKRFGDGALTKVEEAAKPN